MSRDIRRHFRYDSSMISTRRLSSLAPLFLAALLSACSASGPEGAPAASPSASPAPGVDEGEARHAAQIAIDSLTKRKFDTTGCTSADTRVVTEAEANAGTGKGARCGLLVARRADKTWLVVVRAPQHQGELQAGTAQAGSVQALVTVTPGGEGVQHIDYKP